MKITTYIDERLLRKAMRVTKAKSQRAVLEAGLRNLLNEAERREFVKELENYELRFTRDELMRTRQ